MSQETKKRKTSGFTSNAHKCSYPRDDGLCSTIERNEIIVKWNNEPTEIFSPEICFLIKHSIYDWFSRQNSFIKKLLTWNFEGLQVVRKYSNFT